MRFLSARVRALSRSNTDRFDGSIKSRAHHYRGQLLGEIIFGILFDGLIFFLIGATRGKRECGMFTQLMRRHRIRAMNSPQNFSSFYKRFKRNTHMQWKWAGWKKYKENWAENKSVFLYSRGTERLELQFAIAVSIKSSVVGVPAE